AVCLKKITLGARPGIHAVQVPASPDFGDVLHDAILRVKLRDFLDILPAANKTAVNAPAFPYGSAYGNLNNLRARLKIDIEIWRGGVFACAYLNFQVGHVAALRCGKFYRVALYVHLSTLSLWLIIERHSAARTRNYSDTLSGVKVFVEIFLHMPD